MPNPISSLGDVHATRLGRRCDARAAEIRSSSSSSRAFTPRAVRQRDHWQAATSPTSRLRCWRRSRPSSRRSLPVDRDLLSGGAVAGEPFDIDEGAIAAGSPRRSRWRPSIASWPRTCCGRPTRRAAFGFRHPLIRHAVYQSAGAGWCIAAHRRLADELQKRGAGAGQARRARHALGVAWRRGRDRSGSRGGGAGRSSCACERSAALRRGAAAAAGGRSAGTLGVQVALATSLGGAGRLEEARETLVAGARGAGARPTRPAGQGRHLRRPARPRSRPPGRGPLVARGHPGRAARPALGGCRDARARACDRPSAPGRVRADAGASEMPRARSPASSKNPLLEAAALAGVAQAAQNQRDMPTSMAAARRRGGDHRRARRRRVRAVAGELLDARRGRGRPRALGRRRLARRARASGSRAGSASASSSSRSRTRSR